MKKNRFYGTAQAYQEGLNNNEVKEPVVNDLKRTSRRNKRLVNTIDVTPVPTVRRVKNKFHGLFDRYNTDQVDNATNATHEKETFTPDQKKLLSDGLEDLKNTIADAITGATQLKGKEKSNGKKYKSFKELLAQDGILEFSGYPMNRRKTY